MFIETKNTSRLVEKPPWLTVDLVRHVSVNILIDGTTSLMSPITHSYCASVSTLDGTDAETDVYQTGCIWI